MSGLEGRISEFINDQPKEGTDKENIDLYSSEAREIIHDSPEWQKVKNEQAEAMASPEDTILMDENLAKLREFVGEHIGDVSDEMVDGYIKLGEELLQLGDILAGRRFRNLAENEKLENFERLKNIVSDARKVATKAQQSQQEIISFRQELKQYSTDNIESELDKNFIKFAYDRLGNDVSKFDFQSFKPEFDSKKTVSETLENIDITDWRAEEVLFDNLKDFIKDVIKSIYQYVKFIKCLEKMVNSKEKILKNKGDVAYGRDAMRNTAYEYEREEIDDLLKSFLKAPEADWLENTDSYLEMYSKRGMDTHILARLKVFLQNTPSEDLDKDKLEEFFIELKKTASDMKDSWEKKFDILNTEV